MARMNFGRLRQRDRMRRCGYEPARGVLPELQAMLRRASQPRPRPSPPSKESQRQQAAVAFLAWRESHAP